MRRPAGRSARRPEVEDVHLLYYWRGDNYRRNLDHGVGFHPNHANPLLREIGVGDSLWAFTRRSDGRDAMAAELVVLAKTMNPKGYRYGPHRVWGDLRQSPPSALLRTLPACRCSPPRNC